MHGPSCSNCATYLKVELENKESSCRACGASLTSEGSGLLSPHVEEEWSALLQQQHKEKERRPDTGKSVALISDPSMMLQNYYASLPPYPER